MYIKLSEEGKKQQDEICFSLDVEELLGLLTEECGEVIQAAQKVRRAMRRTTPVNVLDAKKMLEEEIGDVLLTLDCLYKKGVFIPFSVNLSARNKNRRWYGRVIGNGR